MDDNAPPIDEPNWVAAFLEALRDGNTVAAATRIARTSTSSPYDRRQRSTWFREAWASIAPPDGRIRANRAPRRARGMAKLDQFLDELAATSNVRAAAEAAGLAVGSIYRRRREDPELARRWYAALAEGYDNLEMELLGHLRAGDEGGELAKGKSKFDTAAALRCLAAHRESVAREKGRRALADEVVTIESINAKIDKLRLAGEAGSRAIAEARREKARRSSSSKAVGLQKTTRAKKGSGDA